MNEFGGAVARLPRRSQVEYFTSLSLRMMNESDNGAFFSKSGPAKDANLQSSAASHLSCIQFAKLEVKMIMALSKNTKDHETIRRWAEARDAVPSEVAATERDGEPGLLRFQFPNARNRNDGALKEISWDEFFDKFDRSDLTLVYQEKTAAGRKSNFNKLVHRDDLKSSSTKKNSTNAFSKRAASRRNA